MTKPCDSDGIPFAREIPEGSGAIGCVGFSWKNVVELLSNVIGEATPEVRKRQTMWIVRARAQGFRIEFFDDEDAFAKRLSQQTDLTDGPQVHAGRLHWM